MKKKVCGLSASSISQPHEWDQMSSADTRKRGKRAGVRAKLRPKTIPLSSLLLAKACSLQNKIQAQVFSANKVSEIAVSTSEMRLHPNILDRAIALDGRTVF